MKHIIKKGKLNEMVGGDTRVPKGNGVNYLNNSQITTGPTDTSYKDIELTNYEPSIPPTTDTVTANNRQHLPAYGYGHGYGYGYYTNYFINASNVPNFDTNNSNDDLPKMNHGDLTIGDDVPNINYTDYFKKNKSSYYNEPKQIMLPENRKVLTKSVIEEELVNTDKPDGLITNDKKTKVDKILNYIKKNITIDETMLSDIEKILNKIKDE